jgi:hypothetical protein
MSGGDVGFVIGLDIDGVCYHWDRTARYMCRRWHTDRGLEVPEALFTDSTEWGTIEKAVPGECWDYLWSTATEDGLFRYGHVVGGAIEGVQALNKMGSVIAITSRPKNAVHDTMVWLSAMFDKAPLSGIVIQSFGQKKSEGIAPRPNIFIDDAMHNIDDLVENTKSFQRAVLFDRPWNQGYDHPHLNSKWRRAVGWDQVVELVRQTKEGGPWGV